jgi:hypothetical protein
MAIITLEQANAHLRLDLDMGSPSDPRIPDVELKMMQAEALILDYLKVGANEILSPSVFNDQDMSVVQAAVLMVLSALYDDEAERTLGAYMAPMGVISLLLMRLRDPTLA